MAVQVYVHLALKVTSVWHLIPTKHLCCFQTTTIDLGNREEVKSHYPFFEGSSVVHRTYTSRKSKGFTCIFEYTTLLWDECCLRLFLIFFSSWTSGKRQWEEWNSWLVNEYLMMTARRWGHTGLIICTKWCFYKYKMNIVSLTLFIWDHT